MHIQVFIQTTCSYTLSFLQNLEKETVPNSEKTAQPDDQALAKIREQNEKIFAFHKDLRLTIEKVTMLALAIIFLVYHTIPTLTGIFIGTSLGFYVHKSSKDSFNQIVQTIQNLWNEQHFRDTFYLVSLSITSLSIAMYPPPVAFLAASSSAFYLFPIIKNTLDGNRAH